MQKKQDLKVFINVLARQTLVFRIVFDTKCIKTAFFLQKCVNMALLSPKCLNYEALESMKRWIQGKSLGLSTIKTVFFTKYSLFTDSKKPKMV